MKQVMSCNKEKSNERDALSILPHPAHSTQSPRQSSNLSRATHIATGEARRRRKMEHFSEWPEDSTRATPSGTGSVWEIEEEEGPIAGASEPHQGVQAGPARPADGDELYVAVGKKSSSMDALSWALKHVATPSTLVYLIHVFPEVHQIPTPLGKISKHQLSPEQVETYMNQERTKRREMLQKFMNLCQASKVQVDTLLIESDIIVKAIVELILVLNIKRLIVGATKSNLRKLRGSSKAEQIQKSAPQSCNVKIICDGKEVAAIDRSMPSPETTANGKNSDNIERQRSKDSVSCHCFYRKFK